MEALGGGAITRAGPGGRRPAHAHPLTPPSLSARSVFPLRVPPRQGLSLPQKHCDSAPRPPALPEDGRPGDVARTQHDELHADLPVVVAAVIRDHTGVHAGVSPGHRVEGDAGIREGDAVLVGGYGSERAGDGGAGASAAQGRAVRRPGPECRGAPSPGSRAGTSPHSLGGEWGGGTHP